MSKRWNPCLSGFFGLFGMFSLSGLFGLSGFFGLSGLLGLLREDDRKIQFPFLQMISYQYLFT